jgi:hypothetical protein
MAIQDLFKSRKEREHEQKRDRRRAFREAENAIDSVKDRARKLQSERDKKWGDARQYLRDGQKASAQRCLQSCRANEQLLTKLELAKTDQEFALSLQALSTVVKIDPEAVADVLGEVEDKLGEQVDTDKIWEKAHTKEMEGVEGSMAETVPSVEQMFQDLEDEVAEAQGDEAPSGIRRVDEKNSAAAADTADLRQRARKIIEGGQS